MSETQYFASTSGYASDSWQGEGDYFIGKNSWSTGSSTMIQGGNVGGSGEVAWVNYYGVVFFDFAAIRGMSATNILTNIRIRLHSHTSATRTIHIHLGKGMPKDIYSSGARPTDATGTSCKTVSCASNGWCQISTNDTAWLTAMLDSSTTCFYVNTYPSGTNTFDYYNDAAYYWEGDGTKTSSPPELYLTWTPKNPIPTAPSVNTPSTVGTASPTFSWGAASDLSGNYSPDKLYYEMQLSADGGSTWGGTTAGDGSWLTSAQGATSMMMSGSNPTLLNFMSLSSGQYFFNPNFKIRVQTKTPDYGTPPIPYRSTPAISNTFSVDYRQGLSAPISLAPNTPAPYEGQAGATYGVKFTIGRPSIYNNKDHTGATMGMHYYVQLSNGMALMDVAGTANDATKETARYTVGYLTAGMSDLSTSIKAYAVDMEGQTSPFIVNIPFAVKRFRAPSVVITGIARSSTSATVSISISDTGYGVPQSSTQMASSNNLTFTAHPVHGGNDISGTITLGTWNGLNNSFMIDGLLPEKKYILTVAVINQAPANTGLANQTSLVYSSTIYEYTPPMAVWKSSAATGAIAGVSAQSLTVGSDFNAPVDAGCIYVENDVFANCGKKVMTEAYRNGGTVNTANPFASFLTQGEYLVSSSSSITGAPHTGAIYGKLIVYVSDGGTHDNYSNYIWQIFYDYQGFVYYRVKITIYTWAAWKTLAAADSFGNLNVVGVLTTGGALTANGAVNVSGTLSANGMLDVNSMFVVDSNTYGATLPAAGTVGRIFFKTMT